MIARCVLRKVFLCIVSEVKDANMATRVLRRSDDRAQISGESVLAAYHAETFRRRGGCKSVRRDR